MIWETIYTLKLKFARTYIPIATATGTRKGFLQIAYYTQDLRQWSIKHIKNLINESISIRNKRQISEYALGIAKELQVELIEAGLYDEVSPGRQR